MDNIANLLTTIRNAEGARHSSTKAVNSKMNVAILSILKDNNYIQSFETVEESGKSVLNVTLSQPLTKHHYKRISKPGRRIYTDVDNIPVVLRGNGMVILSTSEGVISGKEAKKRRLGGEILCEVY